MKYNFVQKFEQTKRFLLEKEKFDRLWKDKINFGCGDYPLPGWLNTDGGDGEYWLAPENNDVVQLDIAEFLALVPDNSVQYIASEQFLEHFSRKNAWEICKQWFRVLKPGGVVRIQVPCLTYLCKLYLNQVPFADWETVQKPRRMQQVYDAGDNASNSYDENRMLFDNEDLLPCHVANRAFYCDGHKYVYDFDYFKQILSLIGFTDVIQCPFGESLRSELCGIDRHDGGESGKSWIPEIALCIEAIK